MLQDYLLDGDFSTPTAVATQTLGAAAVVSAARDTGSQSGLSKKGRGWLALSN
jgi:hypothetical protein